MKQIFFSFVIFHLFSCGNDRRQMNVEKDKNSTKDSFDIRGSHVISDKYYNIANLSKYTDTSEFIARLRYYPAFATKNIIELNEIANGIILSVKEPVVIFDPGEKTKGGRTLAFNQLCYRYAENNAQEIKTLFKKYANNQIVNDISCPSCLDPTRFTVEIYDHGQYSSITKNYLAKEDSTFLFFIFSKVKLTSKNDYSIQY